MDHDSLGDRMKAYEACFRPALPRRLPLIIRVDGRAFHTFTRNLHKPFDSMFCTAMVDAAAETADAMQGFVLGYVQSDEASFYLQDDAKLDTDAWFGKDLCKIVSIAAATMTSHFVRETHALAQFDARAFVVPEAEVANYFLWRAKDWERNSLTMLANVHFSPKQLHGKKRADMHEMLHGVGVNWTRDVPERERNGTFLVNHSRTGNPDRMGILSHTNILPHYAPIAELLESLRPASPEPVLTQTEKET